MGLQFHSKLQEGNKYKPNMNRFFALFAFVATALAEPEADPQILLASAHATSGGLVKHLNGAVTPDDTLAVKVAKAQHLAAKGFAFAPYAYAPYTYAPYAYAPYTYAVPHTVAKREAEADAEADPQFFYNGFYNGYAGYALPYAAYSHVATAPVVTKTEVKQVEPATVKYTAAPATYAYAAPYTYTYPYASYALPAAYHAIAKRDAEAEPEADPAYFYSSYYGHPGYRYSAYRYPYYSAYRYAAPYTYGYTYGK